jgi:NAD(P)-dependent dehydrogenase (short-subunit alcohol dehydrogenase family)
MSLAGLGAQVVLVGRDEARLDAVRVETRRQTNNQHVYWIQADFASLDSVREAAEEIAQRWPALHVVVNNAGVNSAHRATSADGYELTFAVNHLAPFLLTTLLVPALTAGAPSRVVNITSVFAHMGRIDFEDLMFDRRRYKSTRAYTQSKLAHVMFTMELAERLERSAISVFCVSPGLVATDLLREHWWYRLTWLRGLWSGFLLTPDAAAARIVRVATADELSDATGQCFGEKLRPIMVPRAANDPVARSRLWDVSVDLTGGPVLSPRSR